MRYKAPTSGVSLSDIFHAPVYSAASSSSTMPAVLRFAVVAVIFSALSVSASVKRVLTTEFCSAPGRYLM
jgi:hypothetical protein